MMENIQILLVPLVISLLCLKEVYSIFHHVFSQLGWYQKILVIVSFSLIFIVKEGPHEGFLFYLFLALKPKVYYAFTGAIGILILSLNDYFCNPLIEPRTNALINIIGVGVLNLSLFFSLHESTYHFDENSLLDTVRVMFICIFFILSASFLIKNMINLLSKEAIELEMKKFKI